MYKIELHLHTNIRSKCGTLTPEEEIEGYKEAGYAGIVVSDHYNRITTNWLGVDLSSPGNHLLQDFLRGYYVMKELGEKAGLKIYRGAELRFDGSDNDYLVYGYSDKLLEDPEAVFKMGPAAFYEQAVADGALFIQAHPFRKKICPIAPCFVDGYEVINRHVAHINNNDKAYALGMRYGTIMTGGSDCHDREDMGLGGIDAEYLPDNETELAELIRGGKYTILGRDF